MEILNSNQIFKILKSHQDTKDSFLGVFALDEVPFINKFPSCFIINTHKRNQPGEHWLAVYISQSRQIDFFDSYGNPPEEFRLHNYLKGISKNINFNSIQIQGFSSAYCGYYCLFFLLYKNQGHSMNLFINLFCSDPIENDIIIMRLLQSC